MMVKSLCGGWALFLTLDEILKMFQASVLRRCLSVLWVLCFFSVSSMKVETYLYNWILQKYYLVQVDHLQNTTANHKHSEEPCLKVLELIHSFKCQLGSNSHCLDTHNLKKNMKTIIALERWSKLKTCSWVSKIANEP